MTVRAHLLLCQSGSSRRRSASVSIRDASEKNRGHTTM